MPFTHIGSKWNLAPKLVDVVSRANCTTYVEPFAGSLAVLLSKSPHPVEVVNDLDDHIVNFFTVLRDEPDELIRRCMLTPNAREEVERARTELVFVGDPVERARLWWVLKTQTINGRMNSSYKSSPHTPTTDFASRLAAVAKRLQHVLIESVDAVQLIHRMDTPDTVFYLDPPYLGSTRHSGTVYDVDQRGDGFHIDLLDTIRNAEGTVILSGYPSPMYDDGLDGWQRVEWDVMSSSASINGSGYDQRRTEVVWCNRNILHEQLQLL